MRRMEDLSARVWVPWVRSIGHSTAISPRDVLLAMDDEQLLALWDIVYGAAVGNSDQEFLTAFRSAVDQIPAETHDSESDR